MILHEKEIRLDRIEVNGDLDRIIESLKSSKERGATRFRIDVCNDPAYRSTWIETFRIMSKEEVRKEKIEELKNDLKELEDQTPSRRIIHEQ